MTTATAQSNSSGTQLLPVTTIDQFESLRTDWERINDQPLRSFAWNYAWWKNFSHQGSLNILCLEVEGRIVGIAPFFEDQWGYQDRLRFLGSGSTCTDYAELIVEEEYRDQFVEAIVAHVANTSPSAMLEMEGVICPGPQTKFAPAMTDSFWCYEESLEPTWVLSLPSSWDEFRKSSRKSLKRKIKKAIKRLDSESFEIQTTSAGLDKDKAFQILVDLHQSRFVSKGEPGVFSDEHFTSFLREAFMTMSELDRAEIVVGYEDGQPIAAQLYLIGEEGLQLYQAGINAERTSSEPGHLLFTFAVRRAIENGYQLFDFLRGSEPYKPYWGAVPNALSRVRFVSRKIIPTMVNRSYCTLRSLKKLLTRSKAQS